MTFDEAERILSSLCFLPLVCYKFMWLCDLSLLKFEAWTYTFVSRCLYETRLNLVTFEFCDGGVVQRNVLRLE